ncbi:uncharacterized protein LOC114752509 [Neltuma alba]|uniref:uncharacterized protein LOC114752509 n=1 Tax=Neltuma alba TaxID=207710 RepID=UPI0010A2AF21|nr:uncharacterized protein LOC114752509 [Prosopis alba]
MQENESYNREHPPNRHQVSQGGIVDNASTMPSTRVTEEGQKTESSVGKNRGSEEEKKNIEVRGKLQRREGDFTGQVSLHPREEDWMLEDNAEVFEERGAPLSYREALKPKSLVEKVQGSQKEANEAWDGNLVYYDDEELRKGVRVTESIRGPILEFSEEERRRLAVSWQNTLIIKLPGETLGFMHLRRKVKLMWQKSRNVDISDIGNGFMLATFQAREDYYFALEGRPWLIANHYLTVQTWKSNFNPWQEKIQRVALWVRLPGLPGEYYNKKNFYNLGNKIGKAIKVDEMTLTRARTMYARMCVEVDLASTLLLAYTVHGNSLKIEYKGLHLICVCCGKFGHESNCCPVKAAMVELEKSNGKEHRGNSEEEERGGSAPVESEGVCGDWMVVQDYRRNRRSPQKEAKGPVVQKKDSRRDRSAGGGSRFAILEVDDGSAEKIDSRERERRPAQESAHVRNLRERKGTERSQQQKNKTERGDEGKGRKSLDFGKKKESTQA